MFLAAFVTLIFTSVFLPGYALVILIANTLLALALSMLQILSSFFSTFQPFRKKNPADDFVSVLIPTHNEPPSLVMHTLESLARLKYPNFEVLVIDTNTKERSVWEPVQKFVENLGARFGFIHEDELPGFKAGALNYALSFLNPASKYIAVIDADYEVEPEFLSKALGYFAEDNIALVQFPQQYRNCSPSNQPVADEYRHFFKIYMNMANHLDCVPSTGTVSVYTLDALHKIGGFNEEILTEDADAGLRLYAAGYRGVYIDEPVGYGLMPYDIEAYRKQKRRWANGNVQSIRTLLSLLGKIPFRTWLGFLTHLTAWDHLNFIPFAVLASYTVVMLPFMPISPLHSELLVVASLSIFAAVISKLILFVVALRGQENHLKRAFKAFLIHMGMTLLYSEALGAFWTRTKILFERTNKFILPHMPNLLKNSYRELLLGGWFLIGALEVQIWSGNLIIAAAFVVSSLILFSIYYVAWTIQPTKIHSEKHLAELELKYQSYLST